MTDVVDVRVGWGPIGPVATWLLPPTSGGS